MAAKETSSAKSQKMKPHGITAALESAALEWLLIFLLFLDAVFSYLITKFSCRHGLQAPCLLCSRLDHILGNKKKKHYWNLICGNHKLEISSLVFCYAHNNLVDVRGMCESCLFSFATINKSNAETYRLLVGKLGDYGLDVDPHIEYHSSNTRNCSCCDKQWIPKGCNQKLMQSLSLSSKVANLDAPPLSRPLERDWNNRRKITQSFLLRATHKKNGSHDPLTHVGYTELKINSDTESEAQFSADDDGNASDLIIETNTKGDVEVECVQTEPCIVILPDDLPSEKLIDSVSEFESSKLVSQVHSDVIDSNGATSIANEVPMGHGLEELDWKQADSKAERNAFPGLISIDEVPTTNVKATPNVVLKESTSTSLGDVPSSSDGGETLVEASKEKLICMDESPSLSDAREAPLKTSKKSSLSVLDHVPMSADSREAPLEISKESKLISLVDFLPSSDGAQTPIQGLEGSSSMRTEEAWQTCPTCEDICKTGSRPATATEIASEANFTSGDNVVQAANMLDLNDAYKLATSNRGRQSSGKLLEQWVGKDSSRVSEDLKLLISQLSASREQTNDMSPRLLMTPKVSLNSDDLKINDASSSMGMQLLQKRFSLERNESGLSVDGSNVSEIEGESVVDRLKRQVEHDKKLLSALYRELEEERSASAIAANQAMAMITKLQEEKATLRMEALQCLRMMEEQAEYDMEALQKTNDLLAEREKEIQDLEAELEFYRIKYPGESQLDETVEPAASHLKATDVGVDQ
uniref:Myosin-9 n=1 Tax=Rhizophora mucronata TaxID=61149 RepID=A0A2P2MQC6_RHIMU